MPKILCRDFNFEKWIKRKRGTKIIHPIKCL
jgi:hypothetical protein